MLSISCTSYYNIAERPTKGKLVYKYAPFRNLVDKHGRLKDFDTNAFGDSIDVNHPFDIQVQNFSDGSVNLILNDDKNPPRLINSRFSVAEDRQFIVPDHIGNKDTNLYEEEYLDLDTRLQKMVTKIPKLKYNGLEENGKLPCGTYHFYFRLMDNDGNLTDFIAESGPVMVHIGKCNDPRSIRMGLENEATDKSVKFELSNLDANYDFVKVFYTRQTSGADTADISTAFEIDYKFPILGIGQTGINIYGTENKHQCSLSEINIAFEYAQHAKTAAITANRLFLGNIEKPILDYQVLTDFSHRFIPYPVAVDSIGNMNMLYQDYSNESVAFGYYNTKNVYYRTGYWPGEYYRFGIVYILSDFSLSPVFDIQGVDWVRVTNSKDLVVPDNQQVIQHDPFGYILDSKNCQNVHGITRMPERTGLLKTGARPLGVYFKYTPGEGEGSPLYKDVMDQMNLRGFFFVRQNRKPITLAQGMVVGKTKQGYNNFPTLQNRYKNHIYESFITSGEDNLRYLGRSINTIPSASVENSAMIVPDAAIKEATYNQVFTSAEFNIQPYAKTTAGNDNDYISFIAEPNGTDTDTTKIRKSKCTMVNTGMPLTTDGVKYFAARAGEESDPLKALSMTHNWDKEGVALGVIKGHPFESKKATKYIWHAGRKDRLVRGMFGTYVGLSTDNQQYGDICNIRDVRFDSKDPASRHVQEEIRKNDNSPYYAVTERIEWNKMNQGVVGYRGDCFICNYTHRMIRNFIDTELPTNDRIVEPTCWDKNFLVVSKLFEPTTGTYINEIIPRFKAKMVYKYRSISNSKSDQLSNEQSDVVKEMLTAQLIPNEDGKIDIKEEDEDPWRNKGPRAKLLGGFVNYRRLIPAETTKGGVEWLLTLLKLADPAQIGGLNVIASGIQAQMALVDEDAINLEGANLKLLFPTDSKYDTVGSKLEMVGIPNTWYEYGVHNINRSDVNSVGLGHWLTMRVMSNNNLCMRDIDMYNTQQYAIFQRPRSFYPLETMSLKSSYKQPESTKINGGTNNVLSDRWNIHMPDTPYVRQQYDTRIMFSDIQVNGSYTNGFRVFSAMNYKDYTKEYGTLVKILPSQTGLLAVMEHGILMIGLNERALMEANSGGKIAIGSGGNVLSEPVILSDTYGSLWPDSVICAEGLFFGVDTVAKKIWKVAGNQVSCISDFKVQKFLNENIDLKEWDLAQKAGSRNVKTHYNAFKKDVMFTFINGNKEWNLCFNLMMDSFQTFYSWTPSFSDNIDNIYFSFDLQDTKNILLDDGSENITNAGTSSLLQDVPELEGFTWKTTVIENPDLNQLNASTDKAVLTVTYTKRGESLPKENPFLKEPYSTYTVAIAEPYEFEDNKYFTGVWDDGQIISDSGEDDPTTVKYIQYTYTISLNQAVDYKNVQLKLYYPMVTLYEGGVEYLGQTACYLNIADSAKKQCYLWKHGQSGVFDGQGKIKPTNWYGKQHPFEFEFIVATYGTMHKIYNNLMLIANKAQPDTISIEVVGEVYEWYQYKRLIQYMNEQAHSTEQLMQQYKYILTYPKNLWNDPSCQRQFFLGDTSTDGDVSKPLFIYPDMPFLKDIQIQKLPFLRYNRKSVDGIYHKRFEDPIFTNNMTDVEIINDELRSEDRLRSTQQCVDIRTEGRLAGNIQYKEDQWFAEIRPMTIRYAMLDENDELTLSRAEFPRLRDKYARIRVTYTGTDLALVQGVATLYAFSYS